MLSKPKSERMRVSHGKVSSTPLSVNRPDFSGLIVNLIEALNDSGHEESLKRPVKVVFTIAPVESKRSTWPFKPIKFETLTFGNSADRGNRRSIQWSTELGFRTYQVDLQPGGEGVWGYGDFHGVSPGQGIQITEFEYNPDGVHWSEPEPYVDRVASLQSSVIATNKTKSPRNVLLACCVNGEWRAIAAYHRVGQEEYIIAPSELQLQAYVVDIDAPEDCGDIHVLLNALTDFSRPLFSTPLSCDALPTNSTWRLSQDRNGALQLENDSKPEYSFYSTQDTVERLGKLVLDEVPRSLEELKGQVGQVQDSVKDVSARLDSRALAVEDQTARLATVLERIESRLAAVEKSPGHAKAPVAVKEQSSATLAKIAALEKHGDDTRKEISVVQKTLDTVRSQLDGVKVKVPAVGERTDDLARSFGQTQREISAMRESIAMTGNQMRDLSQKIESQLSAIQQSVNTMQGQLNDKGHSIPAVDARAVELEELLKKGLSSTRYEQEAASRGFSKKVAALDTSVAQMAASTTADVTAITKRLSAAETNVTSLTKAAESSSQKLQEHTMATNEHFTRLKKDTSLAQDAVARLEKTVNKNHNELSRERLPGLESRIEKVQGELTRTKPQDVAGPSVASRDLDDKIAGLEVSIAQITARLDVPGTDRTSNPRSSVPPDHSNLNTRPNSGEPTPIRPEGLNLLEARVANAEQKLALANESVRAVDVKVGKVETSLSGLQQNIPRTIVDTFKNNQDVKGRIETAVCGSEVIREFMDGNTRNVLASHVDPQLSDAKTKIEAMKARISTVDDALTSDIMPRLSTIEGKVTDLSKTPGRIQQDVNSPREKQAVAEASVERLSDLGRISAETQDQVSQLRKTISDLGTSAKKNQTDLVEVNRGVESLAKKLDVTCRDILAMKDSLSAANNPSNIATGIPTTPHKAAGAADFGVAELTQDLADLKAQTRTLAASVDRLDDQMAASIDDARAYADVLSAGLSDRLVPIEDVCSQSNGRLVAVENRLDSVEKLARNTYEPYEKVVAEGHGPAKLPGDYLDQSRPEAESLSELKANLQAFKPTCSAEQNSLKTSINGCHSDIGALKTSISNLSTSTQASLTAHTALINNIQTNMNTVTTAAEATQDRVTRLEESMNTSEQAAGTKESAEDGRQGPVSVQAQVSPIEKTTDLATENAPDIQGSLQAIQRRVEILEQKADFQNAPSTRPPEEPRPGPPVSARHSPSLSVFAQGPPEVSSQPPSPEPLPAEFPPIAPPQDHCQLNTSGLSPSLSDLLRGLAGEYSPEPPSPEPLPTEFPPVASSGDRHQSPPSLSPSLSELLKDLPGDSSPEPPSPQPLLTEFPPAAPSFPSSFHSPQGGNRH